MEFFDSHAHYNDEQFENENIIEQLYKEGITKIVIPGYSLQSSKKALEIAKKYSFVYATCGISPNDIKNIAEIEEIEKLANEEKVIAIGEIGLDYYWNKENKKEQKEIYIKQIEIANKKNLPIVIHCRDAHTDLIEILKEKMDCNKKGIFHCVALNLELIKNALNLGYYISFAGPITYKNSKNADDAIKLVPLDKILIETDSPYLSPEPKRGTRNDSTNLVYIAEKISQVKQIKIEEFVKITYENTKKIFNIK